MAKIDLELVKVVLQRSELDAKKIAQIIEDITFESKAQEAEKEKEPQVKKQYVVVVSDPYGKFTDADYTGWVVQPGHSPRTHTFGLVRLQPDPQRQAHAAKNDCRSMRIWFGENF